MMNRYKLNTKKHVLGLLLILITLLQSSCDKLPENGLLDGLWQIRTIETADGVRDLTNDRLYCSFQLKLFQLGTYNAPYLYYGYFKHENGTLRFHSFAFNSMNEKEEDDNVWVQEQEVPTTIATWGFDSTNCTFTVAELTRSSMVLKSDSKTIRFKKL